MNPKLAVTGYIHEYEYSCLTIIPYVLYTLILKYFDSTDKFESNSIEEESHLSLLNNDTLIKYTNCSNSYCILNNIVLGTKVIFSGCYHWIFQALGSFVFCSIGIFYYDSYHIGSYYGNDCTQSLLFSEHEYNINNNEKIEMVLNHEKNLLSYFKNGVLWYSINLIHNNVGFRVGVHCIQCQNSSIQLIDSGYIDSETN